MISGKNVQDYILSDREENDKTTIWDMCRQSGSLFLTGGAIVRNNYATLKGWMFYLCIRKLSRT